MKLRLILLSISVGFSGCATKLNPAYQASLDSWVGAPVVEFSAAHREPDFMIDMTEYWVYVWDSAKVSTTYESGHTTCTGGAFPRCATSGGGAYRRTHRCAWTLRVENKVIALAELALDKCDADERPKVRPDP
jgi:hypothetical protein